MKHLSAFSILLISLLPPVMGYAQSPLNATYEIAVTSGSEPKNKTVRHLTLWRIKHNQVIHQFNQQQFSQHWTLQTNNRVKLIKLFDSHQRGIEYSAMDIKGHQQRDWSEKWQLLSHAELNQMNLVRSYQDPEYGPVEVRNSQFGETALTVEWLPHWQLVKLIQADSPHKNERWQLKSISSDEQKIQQQIRIWDNYYLTDYADIGDNESDPFLMQMINLGFVEEAASGFYNDKGQQIKGQHKHHH